MARTLQYIDGLGAPHTVVFKGRTQQSLKVKRFESIKLEPNGLDERIFQWDEDFHTVYRYRSGYITKAEALALQEMLIYNEVEEVRTGGNVPIHILTKSFKITEELQFLHFVEFDARLSIINTYDAE